MLSWRTEGVPWAVSPSFDAHHVLVAASDGARLYQLPHLDDSNPGFVSLPHPCPVTAAALARTAHIAATAAVDAAVRIFAIPPSALNHDRVKEPASPTSPLEHDTKTAQVYTRVRVLTTIKAAQEAQSANVALSADGRVVVASIAYDRSSGRIELRYYRGGEWTGHHFDTEFEPGRVQLSDDARTVLCEWRTGAGTPGGVALLCSRTGAMHYSRCAAVGGEFATAMDAAGECVALADTNALVLRPAPGAAEVACTGYIAPERGAAVAVSRNGFRVAAVMRGGALGIWRTRDGALEQVVTAHRGSPTGVALIDDRLVSCGFDRIVAVTSLGTGEAFDVETAANNRFTGRNQVQDEEAKQSVRTLVAKAGVALHVPARDVDEIVDFAVGQCTAIDGTVTVLDFVAVVRRVVLFLSKCCGDEKRRVPD